MRAEPTDSTAFVHAAVGSLSDFKMDNLIIFNNLQELQRAGSLPRESGAIFTLASNMVFHLYS
jgi:hypothetical protein